MNHFSNCWKATHASGCSHHEVMSRECLQGLHSQRTCHNHHRPPVPSMFAQVRHKERSTWPLEGRILARNHIPSGETACQRRGFLSLPHYCRHAHHHHPSSTMPTTIIASMDSTTHVFIATVTIPIRLLATSSVAPGQRHSPRSHQTPRHLQRTLLVPKHRPCRQKGCPSLLTIHQGERHHP